jgi:hypothetical protein
MIIIIIILLLIILLLKNNHEHFNDVYYNLEGTDTIDKEQINDYHCILYYCPKYYNRQTACFRCMLKSDLKNLFLFK